MRCAYCDIDIDSGLFKQLIYKRKGKIYDFYLHDICFKHWCRCDHCQQIIHLKNFLTDQDLHYKPKYGNTIFKENKLLCFYTNNIIKPLKVKPLIHRHC